MFLNLIELFLRDYDWVFGTGETPTHYRLLLLLLLFPVLSRGMNPSGRRRTELDLTNYATSPHKLDILVYFDNNTVKEIDIGNDT